MVNSIHFIYSTWREKDEVMQQSVYSNEMENSATSFGWEYGIDPPLACLESLSCFQGEWLSWAAGNVFASYQGAPLYVQPSLPVLRWDPLNLNAEAMLEGLFHQNRCAGSKEPGTCLVIQMSAALNWREVVTCTGRRIVSSSTYMTCQRTEQQQWWSGYAAATDSPLRDHNTSGTGALFFHKTKDSTLNAPTNISEE